MRISMLAYLFTFLVGSIACTNCPAETIACGTTCCVTSGDNQLFSYFCADASKSLCCGTNEHESNGICCPANQNNCGGTCCGGECIELKKRAIKIWPSFHYCFYTTDAQCQNIGAEGLCTPSGGCTDSMARCEGQCCHVVPR
jgi:hypothetical protein